MLSVHKCLTAQKYGRYVITNKNNIYIRLHYIPSGDVFTGDKDMIVSAWTDKNQAEQALREELQRAISAQEFFANREIPWLSDKEKNKPRLILLYLQKQFNTLTKQ